MQEARIHYAYIDAGGEFPNVVQPTAKLLYFVRAPKSSQVVDIFKRVVDIAEGAAKMTGTQVKMEFDSACAEYIVNDALAKAMYANMQELGTLSLDEQDLEYAAQFTSTLDKVNINAFHNKIRKWFVNKPREEVDKICQSSIMNELVPYHMTDAAMPGSTDVGDASWHAPTAQLMTACYPAGTVPHSWQFVACGKSSLAHKGMLYAGKVIAMTALDILTSPELVTNAWHEYHNRLGGEKYQTAIPTEVMPK